MNKLSLNEIKEESISVLEQFVLVCEENNLTYFLAYGTLLGSARHKGFIPWDDDIDIFMPRCDYQKLIKILCYEKSKNLICICSEKNTYFAPFAKIFSANTLCIQKNVKKDIEKKFIIGIFIDIFPLDGISSNYILRTIKVKTLNILSRLLWYKIVDADCGRDRNLKFFIKKILSSKYFFGNYEIPLYFIKLLSKQKPYERSNLVGYLGEGRENSIYFKSDFEPAAKGMFEKGTYNVPQNTHNVLAKCYGNYQELPPKEFRISNHDMECYRKENIK